MPMPYRQPAEPGFAVRLPGFRELRCAHSAAHSCTLAGANLFLASAVSASKEFENAVEIPPDFTGTQVTVPHPANGLLYFKLRDDPETVQTLEMPAQAQGAAPLVPAATPVKPN